MLRSILRLPPRLATKQLIKRDMSLVNTRSDGPVFFIGINRPEKKNCVNHPTAKQLVAAFEQFERDDSAKVAILYGEGGNFCAGYDLSEVSSGDYATADVDFVVKYRYMGPTAMSLSKPLIAAIEGYAVAGGIELALLADLRVVSRSARMGVFCRKVGVPLIDGGTVRLPRVVGMGRALDLILTGREVGSEEAERMGLANRVVEQGQALSASLSLARLIASHPQKTMLVDRASTYKAFDLTTKEALDNEFTEGLVAIGDGIKGAKKFVGRDKSKI